MPAPNCDPANGEFVWPNVQVHVAGSPRADPATLMGMRLEFTDEAAASAVDGELSWPSVPIEGSEFDGTLRVTVTYTCDNSSEPSSIRMATCRIGNDGPGCLDLYLNRHQFLGSFSHPTAGRCVVGAVAGDITVPDRNLTGCDSDAGGVRTSEGALETRCAFASGGGLLLKASFELPAQRSYLLCSP